MSDNTYYVQATIDELGVFASCKYFTDYAATQQVYPPLQVAPGASYCQIGLASGSALTLMGTVFKTLGLGPSLNISNYCPASDDGTVAISMPTNIPIPAEIATAFQGFSRTKSSAFSANSLPVSTAAA